MDGLSVMGWAGNSPTLFFCENSRAGLENQNKVADKEIDRTGKIGNHTNAAAVRDQLSAMHKHCVSV
jgi:hypothetical protein